MADSSGGIADLFQTPTMGEALKGVGSAFDAFGSFEQAGFAKTGAEQEEQAYEKAAQLAGENATVAQASTDIQALQEQRRFNLTMGKQEAELGAAGVATGGSAAGTTADLVRSSAEQGSLAQSLIRSQGFLNTQSYKMQQNAYEGQAQAAGVAASAAGAKQMGSIFSGVLGVAGMFVGL